MTSEVIDMMRQSRSRSLDACVFHSSGYLWRH